MLTKYLAAPLSLALFISSGPGLAYTANTSGTSDSTTKIMETESPDAISTKFGTKNKKNIAQKAYDKAIALNEKGDIGASLLELMKAVNADPTMVKAYYQQALIFRKQNLLKLASSRLEQALAIKPDYNEARVLLAQISIEMGDFSKAIVHLGKSMEKGDQRPQEITATKKKKRSRWFRKKAKKKKNKRISRSKIRQTIAKKYKKFHLPYRSPRHNNRPWYSRYTKILGFANPFKSHKNQTAQNILHEEHTDLQKKTDIYSKSPLLIKC